MDNGMNGKVSRATEAVFGVVVTDRKGAVLSEEELRTRVAEELEQLCDQEVVGGIDVCE